MASALLRIEIMNSDRPASSAGVDAPPASPAPAGPGLCRRPAAGGLACAPSGFRGAEFISRFVARQCPFVAIPVFPSRIFRHSFIFINRKHINKPKDLEAKRIGVPGYTLTAAAFIRGLLGD